MQFISKDDGRVKQAPIRKPVFEKYLPYVLFIFIGYCLADVLILNYRDKMLPTQPPPARPAHSETDNTVSRGAYNTLISRNIFNSDGLIPDPLMPAGETKRKEDDSTPVLTSLPLALKGTIVHSNPAKSIANIEIRSKNQVLAYSIGRDIDGLASLKSVERNKAIFRNTNNNRLEFIEMKSEGAKISFSAAALKPTGGVLPDGKGEIAQVAPNKYEIKRSDLQKYLGNISGILQQASMIPRRGANGEIEGFKFISIQPGSVYTTLGFQNGDTIKGVNGEKIDSPQKAMEQFNSLKDAAKIKILRERDGRDEETEYTVK